MISACVVKRWLGEEIMEYEVEGPWPRGRPEDRTEIVERDCQARKLNEDAIDRSRWRKLIKDGW